MKKQIFMFSGVVALMLISFAPPQKNKVVRLKNGNYELQNLKMEKDDVEKLQELADEMSQWFVENDNVNEKNKQDDGRTKYQDLMTIFESKEGYKAYAIVSIENDETAFSEEVHENIISKILYHDKEKKEFKAKTQQKLDAIMEPYLK